MPSSKYPDLIKRPEGVAYFYSIAYHLEALLSAEEKDCASCKDSNVDLWLGTNLFDLPSCKRYKFDYVEKPIPYVC